MNWFRRRRPCHRPLVRLRWIQPLLPHAGRWFEWECRDQDCYAFGQGANWSRLHDAARAHVVAHHGDRS